MATKFPTFWDSLYCTKGKEKEVILNCEELQMA